MLQNRGQRLSGCERLWVGSTRIYSKESRLCWFQDCPTYASYGRAGTKQATHCAKHGRLLGLVNVKIKKCEETGCTSYATYGRAGTKQATHCARHGQFFGFVDVTNKKYEETGCTSQANYGRAGTKQATHCARHGRLLGLVNVRTKVCRTCMTTSVKQVYKPNCTRCHFYLHPDDPRIRNYKVKEHAFMIPLAESFPDMILDKPIAGGCSLRRPDGLLDCGTHSVVVEIDEDQHVGYDQSCKNRRTIELFTDLGSRPLVLVRLNPDEYAHGSYRARSCFGRANKSQELKILNRSDFEHRLSVLLDTVKSRIAAIPDREIEEVQLFYSG